MTSPRPTPAFPYEAWPRIECSLTIADARTCVPGVLVTYVREGLGIWNGVRFLIEGRIALMLAPSNDAKAGVSIWCEPGMDPSKAAHAIRRGTLKDVLFMDTNGRPVPVRA